MEVHNELHDDDDDNTTTTTTTTNTTTTTGMTEYQNQNSRLVETSRESKVTKLWIQQFTTDRTILHSEPNIIIHATFWRQECDKERSHKDFNI